MSKFINIPLLILAMVTIFMAFLTSGSNVFGTGLLSLRGEGDWLDQGGHAVCTYNGTALGEAGTLIAGSGEGDWSYWDNGTTVFGMPVLYNVNQEQRLAEFDFGFMVTGIFGFLGIIAGIMVMASIIGLRVLGIGISEMSVSTLVKGTAYLSLFLLCSAGSAYSIWEIPYFGSTFYLLLTLLYTLGMIDKMGHVGGASD